MTRVRNHGKPTVLVTNAGRGSAISIIRSLGRHGWNVVAADDDRRSPGFHSRYVHETLLYPSPERQPQLFVHTLHQAATARSIDLIIPVTDAVILPLSEARAMFEGICQLALPEPPALATSLDKLKTLELAGRLSVPAPRTVLVHTVEEALKEGPALGWPLVLKPQASRLYLDSASIEAFTVDYAGNFDELGEHMRRFEGRCPVLLQEYSRGTGYGVEVLMHDGRPVAAFQHKRLREVPVTGGASAFRESVPLDPQLFDYAVRLLAALKWTGLAMVEFKVGPDGPRLMEINGRVWGSLPLAVRSGQDFPHRLGELLLFGHPEQTEPDTSYRIGVRVRNLELDMIWIASVLAGRRRYAFMDVPPRSEAISALFGYLHPGSKFDILSIDDPGPGIAEVGQIVRRFRSKLKERVA